MDDCKYTINLYHYFDNKKEYEDTFEWFWHNLEATNLDEAIDECYYFICDESKNLYKKFPNETPNDYLYFELYDNEEEKVVVEKIKVEEYM